MSTVKSEIVQFGLDLITQKSFSSFSYDEIARQFNMTKAAVHYHFKSKEDLGIAICELLRDQIIAAREGDVEAARKGRHPWRYFMNRFKDLGPDGICPIVSLQADFDNLPKRLRDALKEVTEVEIDNFRRLARAYDESVDEAMAISLLLSLKGALQYRRVLGEKFFRKMVKNIQTQFYSVMPERR